MSSFDLIAQSPIQQAEGLLPHAAVLRCDREASLVLEDARLHQYIVHTKVWHPDGSLSYYGGVYGQPFRAPETGAHIAKGLADFRERSRRLGADPVALYGDADLESEREYAYDMDGGVT